MFRALIFSSNFDFFAKESVKKTFVQTFFWYLEAIKEAIY